MSQDADREPYDYEGAVIGMLTLRTNTPVGEWLSDADFETYASYWREAAQAEGEDETASEYMLLAMMNAAHIAIAHLASLTGEPQSTWLQRIAVDLRGLGRD